MTVVTRAVLTYLKRHWLILSFLILVICFAMLPGAIERMFVYFPIKGLSGSPSDLGLTYQDVFLTTEDGVRLHGWFVPHPDAGYTLLLFHGNAGNISHRLPWIELLHPLAVNIFLVDYRGYGRSGGSPFEEGLYRDARAAYAWWRSEIAGAAKKLVLVGESLGGAVAVDLAAREPVAGLILQSTFNSARDMARTVMPLGLLQPLARIHFDSAAKISSVRCPIFFIHGNRDGIVPLHLGRKLFDAAPGPKDFYEVDGAGHNDLLWISGHELAARLRSFLARLETAPQ